MCEAFVVQGDVLVAMGLEGLDEGGRVREKEKVVNVGDEDEDVIGGLSRRRAAEDVDGLVRFEAFHAEELEDVS